MIRLEGKTALVTGASRGIGRQVAITLACRGANVIVNYNGNKEKAELVVKEIQAAGGKAEIYGCNVTDDAAVKEMIQYIAKQHGSLDILVNNAGITKDGLMMKMSEDDFDAVVDTNMKGTFLCIKHASRVMLKQRRGRIINMSSIVGVTGNAGQMNYAASKAGIIGMTKSAAKELGSRGITVNAVAPGFIETEMTEKLSDDLKEKMLQQIPLARIGQTEDIANAVAFLASDESAYISGQVLGVDGGMGCY
jgi:3-oxoacyl-[acyl-carrier protein] reductase